jgi:hypothetical protein
VSIGRILTRCAISISEAGGNAHRSISDSGVRSTVRGLARVNGLGTSTLRTRVDEWHSR